MSRARYELLEHNCEEMRKAHHELWAARLRDGTTIERQHEWMREQTAKYDALLDRYHELRMKGAEAPAPLPAAIEFDEPDQPPAVVLAAMQQISPIRDKTYEANWEYWERNKARAEAYPDDFANEIILGAVFSGDEVRH